jgi:hypothetical protein
MLVTFCLRLACGLTAALLLLSPAQVAPRFYRTQFLTVLGLGTVALLFAWATAGWVLLTLLFAVLVLSFLGSFVWSLEGAPLGRSVIVLTTLDLATALVLPHFMASPDSSLAARHPPLALAIADDLTSAALLGTALSAMLMGHSYLIAPTMSIEPLKRLLVALFAATFLRLLVAAVGLWSWTAGPPSGTLDTDTLLWLPLRWGLGLLGPLVLGWMAWQTAKIRSTQSATGILYVAVIFCFLGELTSQLLRHTGFTL